MSHHRPGSLRTVALALLLALVAVALPLRIGLARHVHQATSAGLYNEEHVLASLEFRGGDAPLPARPPSELVALVVGAWAPAPADRLADPVSSRTDSRAPPRLA
jgi:hypothetical protein